MTEKQNNATLLEKWEQVVAEAPDAVAIWDGKTRTKHTFASLAERMEAFAERFPGDLYDRIVALYLRDQIDWLVAFIAFRSRRCCLLPLDESVANPAMNRLLEQVGSAAIHTDTGLLSLTQNSGHRPAGAALLKLTSGTTGSLTVNPEGYLCVESAAVSGVIGVPTSDGRKRLVMADRAEVDETGALRLLGRGDRVIKYNGRRYDLDELEVYLREQLQTEEVALVYHDDHACFGLSVPDGMGSSAKDQLESTLPMIFHKVKVKEYDPLPRNARGKLDLDHLLASL